MASHIMHMRNAGAILEMLLSGFQNNCSCHSKFSDLWKEELISVVSLWSRGSGGHDPPETIELL